MAGDWIKMRLDLQTHPKVVRILSATKSDKFRAIGGLHAVWSVFDTHSADGKLSGYTPDTMDHIIGWPGFSAAMIAVEWLLFDGEETLSLPDFDEHNGKSGKRRAEDQKRKRDSRKSPENVDDESGQKADKKRTKSGPEKRREEKRREDENQNPNAPAAREDFPEWMPIDAWHAFVTMRNKIKKPLTDDAIHLAVVRLGKLRGEGHDPKSVLEQSVLNCWQGLFEIKGGIVSAGVAPARVNRQEALEASNRAVVDRMMADEQTGDNP
jgi:hypothetical protein